LISLTRLAPLATLLNSLSHRERVPRGARRVREINRLLILQYLLAGGGNPRADGILEQTHTLARLSNLILATGIHTIERKTSVGGAL
jgi:hypothetical protein